MTRLRGPEIVESRRIKEGLQWRVSAVNCLPPLSPGNMLNEHPLRHVAELPSCGGEQDR